jgi:hypothetical protein
MTFCRPLPTLPGLLEIGYHQRARVEGASIKVLVNGMAESYLAGYFLV